MHRTGFDYAQAILSICLYDSENNSADESFSIRVAALERYLSSDQLPPRWPVLTMVPTRRRWVSF